MFHKGLLCVLLSAAVAFGAGETGTGAPAEESNEAVALPAKDTAEHWVIRAEALNKLIPYMTRKRTEVKDTHKLMVQFLESIGKGEEFVRSGVTGPDTPEAYAQALGILDQIKASGIKMPTKPATWDQLVEAAMQFQLHEGYTPTDVADANELARIREVCRQKELYGQKVRKELRETVKKGLDIWAYLATIDQQADCKAYVYRQREEARLAKEKDQQQRQTERAAMSREVKAQREYEKQRMQNERMWETNYRRMDRYYGYGY